MYGHFKPLNFCGCIARLEVRNAISQVPTRRIYSQMYDFDFKLEDVSISFVLLEADFQNKSILYKRKSQITPKLKWKLHLFITYMYNI